MLPVFPFDDVEDAVVAANALDFGLGGSVWSTAHERAGALAARLEVGTAWVNQHPAIAPDIPFGGAKGSGLGAEFGAAGLSAYTQLQVLNVRR